MDLTQLLIPILRGFCCFIDREISTLNFAQVYQSPISITSTAKQVLGNCERLVMASLGETFLSTFTLCLSCFRCQPLSYHSIIVNYQPLSYEFACQPLLCTCVLCTVYCCIVLCTSVQYILGLSCLAVNLSFMILVVNLYYVLVYCVLVYCAIYWCTNYTRSVMFNCQP